jgi:hypothetical protein
MNEKLARVKAMIVKNSNNIIAGSISGLIVGVSYYFSNKKRVAGCEVLTAILDDFADGKKHLAWLDGGLLYIDREPHKG